MNLFTKKGKSSIGLDVGSSLIKMVEIDHLKEEPVLMRYGIIKIPPEAIVEGEIMDRSLVVEGIQECAAKAGISRKNVVTAVSGRAVIVKKVVMDKMNPDDAKEAIFWEAEQHVPFDIDDVCLDFQILKEDVGANQMEILLVAAKKEMVNTHANLVRDAGLAPVVIDVDSFAIQNAYELASGEDNGHVTGLVNIGSEVTNINIIQGGIPHFTRDLSLGSNIFLEAMQRDMEIGFEEAEAMLTGEQDIEDEDKCRKIITEASEELSTGIERSISFLKTAGDAESIDKIILSGGGARIPWLQDILSEKHQIDFTINDAADKINHSEELDAEENGFDRVSPLLVVSIGLALRREGN